MILAACAENQPSLIPSSQPLAATFTSQPTTTTPTIQPPTPTAPLPTSTSTLVPATATVSPTPIKPLPQDQPLIAYESGDARDKRLILFNPSDGTVFEFNFPDGAIFATPFLAGLSPDAQFFVYAEAPLSM